jgi:hypothetical protein
MYILKDHHQLVDAVLLEGLIVAPLTSSPIRADRLWAQEREYIVPRSGSSSIRSVKNFSSSRAVQRRDDFMSLGGLALGGPRCCIAAVQAAPTLDTDS